MAISGSLIFFTLQHHSAVTFYSCEYLQNVKEVGSYVIVHYEGELFPGKNLKFEKDGCVVVSCIHKYFK